MNAPANPQSFTKHWDADHLHQCLRYRHDWLLILDQQGQLTNQTPQLMALIEAQFQEVARTDNASFPLSSVITTLDPLTFLGKLFGAALAQQPIFLGNPHWQQREWQQVEILLGDRPPATPDIHIPTGGTSGQIRFAIHAWSTLSAAITGMQSHFFGSQVQQPLNGICVLPLYHVSGLMQVLRSLFTGGQVVLVSGGVSQLGKLKNFEPGAEDFFLSLVPTQLQELLMLSESWPWLQDLYSIILGGAPPWPSLLTAAAKAQFPLCLSYGMTETAALITCQGRRDFCRGDRSCGQVLPHGQIQIMDRDPQTGIGTLAIESTSLAKGYYPQFFPTRSLMTDDRGYFDVQGQLHLVGRQSRKIISGGENIYPEEIEAALYDTGFIQDVYVCGQPDAYWGERVIAYYVPAKQSEPITSDRLAQALKERLAAHNCPKEWVALESLPRNAQGKLLHHRIAGL